MRKITILYDGSHYLYRWLKPLIAARKEFQSLGYDIGYADVRQYLPILKSGEEINLHIGIKHKHDIVFMAFHHNTSKLGLASHDERIDILKLIKNNCNRLIWLDAADSTGTCLFDVMPYVDVYFKKQLLKDISSYTKPIYGSRLYCDYYHNLLKVEDPSIAREYPLLDMKYANKIQISWNVGLGDLFAKGYRLVIHPFKLEQPEWINPDSETKNLDIHFRGGGNSPIVTYQRSKCKELVSGITNLTHPDPNTKVPYVEYMKEIKRAKMVLSPFGLGEICTRDFESFAYGATMLKPSMEHCITYPNWYQPNKTYVPIKWDFSNFNEVLNGCGTEEYKTIAKNGQDLYKYYRTSPEARLEFAKHVIDGINLKQKWNTTI